VTLSAGRGYTAELCSALLGAVIVFVLRVLNTSPQIIGIVWIIVLIAAVPHFRVILVAAIGDATGKGRREHRDAKAYQQAMMNVLAVSPGGNCHFVTAPFN
jgi:hypothetical protein